MIRRPPRSTPLYSSAASDVYKRQGDAEGPEDRHGAEGLLGDPRVEGEGARGGGGPRRPDADEPVRSPCPRGGPLSRTEGVRRVAVEGGGRGRARGGRGPRGGGGRGRDEGPLSLIHISEPTRLRRIS